MILKKGKLELKWDLFLKHNYRKKGVYAKEKYHYAGDFPNGLAIKYAFVHTMMFLGWIVDHDLFSEEFEEDRINEIEKFKQRALTGTQIYEMWDGVLSEDK